MKAKNKYSLFVLMTVILSVCLSACTKESEIPTQDEQKTTFTLYTRAGNSQKSGETDEDAINTVRAIVFEVNEYDNTINYTRQVANQLFRSGDPIKLSFDKCDNVRVLLIANEKSEWNLANRNKTATEIKEINIIYGDFKEDVEISSPFFMFCESNTLSGQTDNNVSLQLIRNIARIDLSLTCKASDVTGLNGGTLKLTGLRIERMAPEAGLGISYTGISQSAPEDYLTSKTLELIEGINYFPTYNDDKTFSGFTTNGISFYVTEHYVTNKDLYTYISIFGTYTSQGSTGSFPVEYTLPIGSDITQKKIEENLLTPSELTLMRNNLYEMKASFKNLQKVSEVYVNVKPWDTNDVNGSIHEGKYYLNVSDIDPTLSYANDTVLIQFWSNLPASSIRVLPTTKENGSTLPTNNLFISLAKENGVENPTNIEFVENNNWGRLRLVFNQGAAEPGKTYEITLAAGYLERTINIKATE